MDAIVDTVDNCGVIGLSGNQSANDSTVHERKDHHRSDYSAEQTKFEHSNCESQNSSGESKGEDEYVNGSDRCSNVSAAPVAGLSQLESVAAYTDKECHCIELCPEEGTIILFPSWLHHAVVPLAIQKEHRDTAAGVRVSVAFNFSEIV